jgi:hypothetical protein
MAPDVAKLTYSSEIFCATHHSGGASMPLTRNANQFVFDPEAIEPMVVAFKAACHYLQLFNRDDLLTQIVAKKVVEVAGAGERDPERLRDLVLLALEESDQRSA